MALGPGLWPVERYIAVHWIHHLSLIHILLLLVLLLLVVLVYVVVVAVMMVVIKRHPSCTVLEIAARHKNA